MGMIDVINVQDNLPENETADGQIIQDALDEARVNGGVVYIPSGWYDLGDQGLVLNRPVILTGAGIPGAKDPDPDVDNVTILDGTKLRYTGTGAAIQINGGWEVNTQKYVVRDLAIDCEGEGHYGISLGAEAVSAKDFVSAGGLVENVTVLHAKVAGVKLVASQLNHLTNVRCESGEKDGFITEPRPNSVNPNTSTIFTNCHAKNNKKRGVYFTQLTSSIWVGGTIEQNGEEGIYLLREKRTKIAQPPGGSSRSEFHPDVGAEQPAEDTPNFPSGVEVDLGTGELIATDGDDRLGSATNSLVFDSIHIEGNNKGREGEGYAQFKISSEVNQAWQEIELRNLFFSRAGSRNHHISWSKARGTIWFPYFQNPSGRPAKASILPQDVAAVMQGADEMVKPSYEPRVEPIHLPAPDLPTAPDTVGAVQDVPVRPVIFIDSTSTICAVFAENNVNTTFEVGASAKVTVSRYANGAYSVYTNDSGLFVETLKVSAIGIKVLGDIEVSDRTNGLILLSPNNKRFRVTVDNNGILNTIPILTMLN